MLRLWISLALTALPLLSFAAQDLSPWQLCSERDWVRKCTSIEPGVDLRAARPDLANEATYEARFYKNDPCFKEGGCWLYLGEVADTAKISLNGSVISNFKADPKRANYIRHKSILVPLPETGLKDELNLVNVEVADLNASIFGLRTANIRIGTYDELNWESQLDWLKRTGSSLMSVFALLVMATGLFAVAIIGRSREAFYLGLYSSVTAAYHVSFSELIREAYFPMFASGPVHFGLRLSQDVSLFLALVSILKPGVGRSAITAVCAIYGCAIIGMFCAWLLGYEGYTVYMRYMYVCAPLVAFPVFFGLYASFGLEQGPERKVLVPAFMILAAFQVNDLLVFWQIYRGVFFVRWYPAFVVTLLGCVHVIRKVQEVSILAKDSAVGQLASQVAHDIRSPLAALKLVLPELGELQDEKRVLVGSAIDRISDIANQLIGRGPLKGACQQAVAARRGAWLLSAIVDSIVSEKRTEYRHIVGVNIMTALSSSSYGLFSDFDPAELKRVLSNLINNAVDAIRSDGMVTVALSSFAGKNWIVVQDDGQGIPKHLLSRIGSRGFTYGKEYGSGLGLHHACTVLEHWGGELEVASEEGVGTTVTLGLPKAKPPAWFLPQLRIKAGMALVVVDDDRSIHQAWQKRILSFTDASNIHWFHFSSVDEFSFAFDHCLDSAKNDFLFLVDHDLRSKKANGMELIIKKGIRRNAVLVTSLSEDQSVLSQCEVQGIQLLPKSLISNVPILWMGCNSEQYDSVLIDDDPLVHSSWQSVAAGKGKSIRCFFKSSDFILHADSISTQTPIYIDSHLGEPMRGEEIAKGLTQRGFEKVYLTIGSSSEVFEGIPWVAGIAGKEPPF